MECTRCGFNNDASVNFCISCGAGTSSLASVTPPPVKPAGKVWPILRLAFLGLLSAVPCNVMGTCYSWSASVSNDSYGASLQEFGALIAFVLAPICTFIAVPTLWESLGHRKKKRPSIFESQRATIPFWVMCLTAAISVMLVFLVAFTVMRIFS